MPEVPVSQPGDLWVLGSHRLLCGDATKSDVVARVLGGVTPHLMATDPPFGVNYDPDWRNRAGASETKRTGKVLNDHRADWREAWALFPGDVAYVWHGALHATTVAESLTATGFEIRSQIIWAKERHVLSRGHYHWQHEPAWYAVRGKGHWSGDRRQSTLWSIPSRDQDAATVHGTQRPTISPSASWRWSPSRSVKPFLAAQGRHWRRQRPAVSNSAIQTVLPPSGKPGRAVGRSGTWLRQMPTNSRKRWCRCFRNCVSAGSRPCARRRRR